jgi:hypothetical protein
MRKENKMNNLTLEQKEEIKKNLYEILSTVSDSLKYKHVDRDNIENISISLQCVTIYRERCQEILKTQTKKD